MEEGHTEEGPTEEQQRVYMEKWHKVERYTRDKWRRDI